MRKNHSTSPFSDPFDRRNYSSSRETPARNNLSTATLTDLQSQFSKSKNPTFSHERVSKLYTLFHDIKHAVYTATSRNNVESNGPASREKRVESIKQSLEEAKTTSANLILKAQQNHQKAVVLEQKTQRLIETAERFQNTAAQPSFLATLWQSFLGWLATIVDRVSDCFKNKKHEEQPVFSPSTTTV